MMKRLTALTLAMLMLLNPMTAFAVEWGDIVTVLKAQNAYKQDGVDIDVNAGAVTVNSGNVENFFHDSEFNSYTFTDTVNIGGDTFYVFVNKGESVTVDIQSGAVVSATCGVNADVDGGSLTISNAGTVESEIFIYAADKAAVTVNNSGTVMDDLDIDLDGDNSTVSVSNSGTVNGEIDVDVDGTKNIITISNSGTITDDGDIELDLKNDKNSITIANTGTIEDELDIDIDGASGNTVTATNTGSIGGSMDAEIYAIEEYDENGNWIVDIPSNDNTVTLINSGDIAIDLDATIYASNHNSITINNSKDIGGSLGIDIYPGSSNSATINSKGNIGPAPYSGTEEEIYSDLYANIQGDDNSVTISSEGDIAGLLYAYTEGDGNSITVSSDGDVAEQVFTGAIGESTTSVLVSGTADTAVTGGYEGGETTLGVLGGSANPIEVYGDGKAIMMICAGNGSLVNEDVLAGIINQTIALMEDMTGSLEVITTDNQGNKTARYSVAPDGTVKLKEAYPQDSGSSYDDPATWTAERKRHDKEEERKASAIGGVTGSPYWVKQLYIGYMSLNLRLFDGEEQMLFKEHLSWQEDGSKLLTLRTKLTDTSNLMMRLDGMAIAKLKQAGISAITIVDGNGNPFMTYAVSDMEGARAMYDLEEKDYIVVGEATDDVMMIGADGKIVPIEGESEAPAA